MQLVNKVLMILGVISLLVLSGCSQKVVEPTVPVVPEVQPVTPVISPTPVVDNSILDENDASVSIGEVI